MLWIIPLIAIALADPLPDPPPPPVVVVDRDNVEIAQSCTIEVIGRPIADADGNGVVHITADNITVNFAGAKLNGAVGGAAQEPDTYTGIGIRIAGKNVTLTNATVSGYKVGIHALSADGLTLWNCDATGNFRQRLKSTPQAEDASDWLWPHANDDHQWMNNYGAGVCIERSSNVTLSNVKVHRGQNGIILDRVNDSKVFDCDCSFLSGWGLAMWRSNRNIINRNAFDYCIRGYSHGVYNRGQDSAGILLFEQCSENIIAQNSATRCGDGLFGFAGKEALGEIHPRADLDWYKQRGCNKNLIVHNDFSHAAAHGLEMTFSFSNVIEGNRFVNNAICGIWGGYSQNTLIRANAFVSNGDMGYGSERGGINIEHGSNNVIALNRFESNACGVYLWWDEDPHLQSIPWAKANGVDSVHNQIIFNGFMRDKTAIQLRATNDTIIHENAMEGNDKTIDSDDVSRATISADTQAKHPPPARLPKLTGSRWPLAAREHLGGREGVIITEWGPWDHESPLLQFMQRFDRADEFRLAGVSSMPALEQVHVAGNAAVEIRGDRIIVSPREHDTLAPYAFSVHLKDHLLKATGVLTGGMWEVWTFSSAVDPRHDIDRWRSEGQAQHHTLTADPLIFRFGSGGMSEVRGLPVALPRDHFGVIATRTLTFPAGTWRIKTIADDGIRVWLDDKLVIDDWTWHPPKSHDYELSLKNAQAINMRVEYFELDGYAALSCEIEQVE